MSNKDGKVNINSSDQYVVVDRIKQVEDRYKELKVGFEKLEGKMQNDNNELKKDYLLIFGIFASILTFLGIEISVFQKINSFSKIAGLSMLILASFMLFLFSIQNIIKSETGWKSFLGNFTFWLILGFIVLAGIFFYYSVAHKVLFLVNLIDMRLLNMYILVFLTCNYTL